MPITNTHPTVSSDPVTTDPTPRIKHVRAAGTWQGRMTTSLRVRHFEPFATGEPVKAGGDDSAPTPMEYVAAALNGCLAVVVETVAGELGLEPAALELDTDATMDTRGFAGTADVPPYFTAVAVAVRLDAAASPEQVEQLRAESERRCPALTLVAAAGVPVEVDWHVAPGAVGSRAADGGGERA